MSKKAVAKAVAEVRKKHPKARFCCHADRGPCIAPKTCGVATCGTCAPDPWNHDKPIWPCPPIVLADAVDEAR